MTRPPSSSIPTLGDLQRQAPHWWWLYCDGCGRARAIALAPLVIRWGADTSSDRLRRSARCTCGHLGAKLRHPTWLDIRIGWEPFPVDSVK